MSHKTFCDVTFQLVNQSSVSQSFRLSHDTVAVMYDF